MGNYSSTPAGVRSHSWESSGAPRPDHDLAKSLQSSSENDVSRAQILEQAVQERVADELKRLAEKELSCLRQVKNQLSAEASNHDADGDDDVSAQLKGGPSRFAVSKEVEGLRAKLKERISIKDVPESVTDARAEMLRCLRENDRRPLDCWREVRRFKQEVYGLEREWVENVAS